MKNLALTSTTTTTTPTATAGNAGNSNTTSSSTTPAPHQLSLLSHTTVLHTEKHVNEHKRLHINHCHDSFLYILGPVRSACIVGCTDCTILVGSVATSLSVVDCERVKITTCCKRLLTSNCLDTVFYLFTTSSPILVGDNRGCRLAPYNSSYPGMYVPVCIDM